MKKSTIGIIASMLFMMLTIGAFYYLWSGQMSQAESANTADVAPFAVVDISGIKDEATKITTGYENNAGLPIPAPTAKLGKTNPFNAPE